MSADIKLLQIVYSLDVEGPGGGITRFASELARELTELSFEVALGALWDYGTAYEAQQRRRLQQEGISSFAAATWTGSSLTRGFLAGTRTILQRQRQESFDIVHSHSEFGDIAALITGLLSPRLPLLRTVHYGYGIEWRHRPLRRYVFSNFLIPLRFQREIGVSPQIVGMLDQRPLARWIAAPSVYIPNAVNLERFKQVHVDSAALKKSLGIPLEAFVIGSVGRLTEQKGYDILLQAAQYVLAQDSSVVFLIVGDGAQRGQLEALAAQLGIRDSVRLTGSRPDVEQLLAVMDLFVSSSRWEGLPTVIMESMAAGVPVVATDIPGSRELVRPRISGWLARPEDPPDLAERIHQAVGAVELRAAYAEGAQEIVQHYTIKNIARQYAELYRSVAGQ